MLAIEIDGERHIGKEEYDAERQERLESLGVRFFRFDDLEVRQNLEGVVSAIEEWIRENGPQSPADPLPGRKIPSREGVYGVTAYSCKKQVFLTIQL